MPRAQALPSPSWTAQPPLPADAGPCEPQLLDEPDEWQAFSRRLDGAASADAPLWESSVALQGMHCAACAVTIERLLGAVPGVVDVAVSAAAQRARVVWDAQRTRPSQWLQALRGSAYRALPLHDADASALRRQDSRRMAWRLGVAGLCMMQVMMYAVPGYIAGADSMAADTRQLLRWAQWMLALPVLLFSCQPFFAAAWRDLKLRRISMDLPVALAMGITFTVSSVGTFQPDGVFGHQVYFDSLTMFAFFLLAGRWLELRLRDRAAGALEALMHRLPQGVLRQDARGQWQRVALRRLRVGDVVRVLPGETFPADGTLLAGSTTADEALLTGESRPVRHGPGDAVVAGSGNLSAAVDMRVGALGGTTRYAQIVALMQQAATSKPALARLVDRAATPFLVFVLVAATAAALLWWRIDPARALMVAVAVLVITCPCALSLATPAAMLASAGALARRGLLVRHLQALETLARVDTVVFDKTGTLTQDAFGLERVAVRAGVSQAQALAWAAALARHSLHPAARAIAAAALQQQAAVPVPDVGGATEEAGRGVRGQLLGPDSQARALRLGSAAFCGTAATPADGPVSHLADDSGWIASFYLQEAVRPDARASVAALQRAGIAVHLISGDQPQAARHVAQQLGIRNVAAACSPDDKLQRLRALQQAGACTTMVGDGLNDGPVLAAAHVSFAFGQAVPLAQGQSDLVVLNQRLGTIVDALAQSRRTLRVVRQNLRWALTYNVAALPIAFSGLMPAWLAGLGMAASSLVVVGNAARLNRDQPGAS